MNEPSGTPPTRTMPGAKSALTLLLLINLMNYVDRSVLYAVLSEIQKDIFTPDTPNQDTKLGFLSTAFMVTYMIMSPVFGWLGDRVKRWVIVGVGVILWSIASGASGAALDVERVLASAGLGAVSGYVTMLITRMFVGVGEAAYGPIAPTIISDLFPVSRRGAVMSLFYMAVPVGTALGYVLGGYVAKHWGWKDAFYAVAPPGILLGLWCFFMPDPKRGATDTGATHRKLTARDYRILLKTPSYVLCVAGMTAMTFALGGVNGWMPKYLHVYRQVGEIDKVNAKLGMILVVAGLIATITGGWLSDRLRKRYSGSYFLVSGVGMTIGFPLFVAVMFTPFPACWFVIFAAIFCLFLGMGPTNTIIANVTHPSMRASAYALCILTIHMLGDVISPPLIGFVTDRANHNMNAGFGLVSVTILIAGILWILGAKHLARDTEAAPTRLTVEDVGSGGPGRER